MPRVARIVIPGIAHHVTQRGNRRQAIFVSDADRHLYLKLLGEGLADSGTTCTAWCLMDNHVHLVLVPADERGLREPLGRAHQRYTWRINQRDGHAGHLFEARFASYPMDDAHLVAAVRYVENNPVKAGMVARAEDWPWSSARSHVTGRRVEGDPLTDVAALGIHIRNWRAYLADGAEAADRDDAIEARLRDGRPLARAAWIALREGETGRSMTPGLRGRPARSTDTDLK